VRPALPIASALFEGVYYLQKGWLSSVQTVAPHPVPTNGERKNDENHRREKQKASAKPPAHR
jgi:hypothetical protein